MNFHLYSKHELFHAGASYQKKTMIKTPLFLLCLLILIVQSISGAELHVSPSGDDTNPGSADKPLFSLKAARDAVRKIKANMNSDLMVYLHGGEYILSETVVFDHRDSGQGDHKVIYRAVPGQTPILTGAIKVTHWQPHNPDKNIFKAQVSTKRFRQLYLDDVPAIRSRTPNQTSETDRSPYWPCIINKIPEMTIKKEHWAVVSDIPKHKLSEVEMVMICHWYHQRVRIGEVKVSEKEAVVIKPLNPKDKFNKKLHFYKNNRGMKNPFYFENALEFLDAPYEWYHDPDEGSLYLALPHGVTPDQLRIEIPVTETLISLQGTPENPIQDIEFHGITFQSTNWAAPSFHGVNMTQAAQVVGGQQPPAMLRATHSRRLAFRNNVFHNSGGQGISLLDADTTDLEGNTFNHIAANGITVDHKGGRNPSADRQSIDVAIWNNHAKDCGNHYSNGMFLFTENVTGLIVEHNHIHNMPYSGMQIGQQPGSIQYVGAGNNIIRFNHIHHCNLIHGDGGGIYTLGGIQEGTVIESNYLHDITQPKWDHYRVSQIYLDNYSSRIMVRNNVINGGKAEQRNKADHNTFINNNQSNPTVEKLAGIKPGYHPRQTKEQ